LPQPQNISQEERNLEFTKTLKLVYNDMNQFSDLLWSAQDANEIFRKRSTRKKELRSDAAIDDDTKNWKEESNASIGYGEITRVSKLIVL